MNNTTAIAMPPLGCGRTVKFWLGLVLASFLTMLFVVLLTVGAVTYFRPKEYFSKVTMEVRPDSSGRAGPFAGNPLRNGYDAQFIARQFEIFQKAEVLYPVIERIGLTKAYAPAGETISESEAYSQLKKAMTLHEVRNNGLIEIGIYDRDAQRAADIANTVAFVYQDIGRANFDKINERGLKELQDELERQRKRKADTTALAARIRQRYGITDSDPEKEDAEVGFTDAAAKEIEAQADAAQVQLIKEAKLKEYRDAKKNAVEMRKILEQMEVVYTKQKMTETQGIPMAVIWEKAEASAEPVRPNVVLYGLLAAPVGLILGAGLYLLWDRKTRGGKETCWPQRGTK